MKIEITDSFGNREDVVFYGRRGATLLATFENGRLGEIDWCNTYIESLTPRQRDNLADRFDALEEECRKAWTKFDAKRKAAGPAYDGEKLFNTGWTGGIDPVFLKIFSDRAEVNRMEHGGVVTVPLSAAQVQDLSEVFNNRGGATVEAATAIALLVNEWSGGLVGTFSTMAGGEVGRKHDEQMGR